MKQRIAVHLKLNFPRSLEGRPLPAVSGVTFERVNGKTNNFDIRWNYPALPAYDAESKNWEYAVFYGKSGEELAGKSESSFVIAHCVRIYRR